MAASFPGSVKTFTTKAAGNTIQAADVNDLQDEVNAVEDGLINGPLTLARLQVTGGTTLVGPLNSSASTLASLSVTAGTTLGGAVVATSTGGMQIGGLYFQSTVVAAPGTTNSTLIAISDNVTILDLSIPAGNMSIHGITAGTTSKGARTIYLYAHNDTSGFTLKHQSATCSSADARLILPSDTDYTVSNQQGVWLTYLLSTNRWVVVDK